MFIQDPLAKSYIPRIETTGGRQYKLPSGILVPSVTTVLGNYYKKDLSGWIKWVGETEALRIMRQAGVKGTALHKMVERYVTNLPMQEGVMPFMLDSFSNIKPILDKHITKVYGAEHPLYSKILQTAGTCDLLCEWDGKPTIVDLKTSIKVKKEEWIESYFVQAATYGIMASSMYSHIDFLNIVIIMAVDHDKPIIFEKSVLDYVGTVKKIFVNRGVNEDHSARAQ